MLPWFRCSFIAFMLAGVMLAGCSGSQETAEEPVADSEKEVAETRIAGDWEGELNALGASLPIVVHITETENGELRATMDSPEQNAFGIRVNRVAFDGMQLRLEVNAIGGTYIGRLQEGTETFTGQWTQSGQSFALDLQRTDG